MKLILRLISRFRKAILLSILFKLIATMSELLLPYILEHMIDDIAPTGSLPTVLLWGAIMIACACFTLAMNVCGNRNAVRSARECSYTLRGELFHRVMRLSGHQVDTFGLPSLTSRMTSDSYNVQSFIQSSQTLGIRAPILLFGGMFITLTMDAGLACVLCALAPVMAALLLTVSRVGMPLYTRVQQGMDTIVRILRENISGIRVVKALSKEKYETARYAEANRDLTGRDLHAGTMMAMPGPLISLLLNTGLTLVVLYGSYRVNNGVTKPGVILAFLTYFNLILNGVMGLNRLFVMMSKANASANRIDEVLQAPEDMAVLPEAGAAEHDPDAMIVFDHVTFTYDSELGNDEQQPALRDIDFTVRRGGSLGIIGATGSGKSTIVNLMMRFYDPQQGRVLVNGRDVRTQTMSELRSRFGVVFQSDMIFADSIRENITFGRDVSPEAMRLAAVCAQADSFIGAYDDGYEHRADIHGANFSGGQRQRMLIARALAAHPDILVLDDSSSALDYRTDAALRRSIREEYGDATLIVIAQRVSSILALDRILVLDEGQPIGYGTHEELLKSCDPYREIYEHQMKEGDAQ